MGKDSFLIFKGDKVKPHKLHINLKYYKPLFNAAGAKKKYFNFPIVNKIR